MRAQRQTRGIRIDDSLAEEIEQAGIEDERDFSKEVRFLVKLGLERRARMREEGAA